MPKPARWSLLALPLLVALLLGGAPGVLAQEEEFDRIAAEVAAIRELPPLEEITEVFMTREELLQELPAIVEEEYPAAEAAAHARGWVALGLIPPGTDLAQLYLDLLGEQVAGYYDPETDEMVVISGTGELGAIEEFTYAHEVVHALQDAHLGLGDILDTDDEISLDAALAIISLYEGDAMAATLDYLLADPVLAARVGFAAQPESPLLDQAPLALSMWLLVPYGDGMDFVNILRAEGGWSAVDAAYADLPASTEQILHPEKYLERDDPTPVALPDPTVALGAGWTIVDEDTLGELHTAILLADLPPGQGALDLMSAGGLPGPARNAAAGWDGDRYALWANGDQEVLVWQSVWDNDDEARAFARALGAYAEGRFGGTLAGESADDLAMTTEAGSVRIARDGATVAYVLAPNPELADQAIAALRGV